MPQRSTRIEWIAPFHWDAAMFFSFSGRQIINYSAKWMLLSASVVCSRKLTSSPFIMHLKWPSSAAEARQTSVTLKFTQSTIRAPSRSGALRFKTNTAQPYTAACMPFICSRWPERGDERKRLRDNENSTKHSTTHGEPLLRYGK